MIDTYIVLASGRTGRGMEVSAVSKGVAQDGLIVLGNVPCGCTRWCVLYSGVISLAAIAQLRRRVKDLAQSTSPSLPTPRIPLVEPL